TGKLHSDRPAQSPSQIPIQPSSISAPVPTACAATSQPDAACTNRPTKDKPGSSSVYTTPDRSAQCAFIQRIRTSFGSLPSATSSNQTTNAASSKQLTAARRGAKS